MKGLDRLLAGGAVAVAVFGGSLLLGGCTAHGESAPDALKHPCLLLSASQAADVLGHQPGAAQEITQEQVSECAYREGELYVSVAHASYDRQSFRDVVDRTKGQPVTEPGLGDAAYSFHVQEDARGYVLLDVLKGSRLVQITAPTAAEARKAASSVLPQLR
ncbi:hypothetical protein ACFVT9_07450 [Kitasatospora cineracea]|uniref:hypothetical protein n=1 Tax=Kitasatospora cineracea TaxID=88074 RepID=UPI0033E1F3AB